MPDQHPPKHRVIDWNPAAHQGAKTNNSSGRNKAFAAIAIVAVLLGAGAVAYSWRAMNQTELDGGAVAATQPGEREPAYVSRGRAELAFENATQALNGIRKLPANHPNLLQEVALIEKGYLVAEGLLKNGDYAQAANNLETVNRQMEEFTETVTIQKNANKRSDELLSRLRAAERNRSFSPETYDQAFNAIGEGRLLLEQGSFRAAWQSFDTATSALDDFETRKTAFIEDNLQKGQIALNEGQKDAADTAFKAALKYDSANEAGLRGLKRAETIAEVHRLLAEAQAAEETKDFDPAIAAFDQAFELDKLSVVAQQGSARAKAAREEALFTGFVSQAEAAAENAEWDTVITSYEEALKVYPKRDDIKTALATAKEEHHAALVLDTLAKAYDLERDFKWDEARNTYEELLKLEPNHQDAIDGLIRVGRTVRAKLEFEKLIELAQQHIQAADFQAAIRTYNAAMQTKPGYLEISPEVASVRDELERNSRPINITFLSDARTWVSISNFRMLGKVKQEVVALPPGDYEVVGRRKNYKDVLLLLKVRPGMSTDQVSVVCNARTGT